MSQKRSTPLIASLIASLLVIIVVFALTRITRGDSSLLRNGNVDKTSISPNADGSDDVTNITYEITRDATVSIYFEDSAGERFTFRNNKTRGANSYSVQFSGVVDGYLLPGEQFDNQIEARLLQNGTYTWIIEAVDKDGVREIAQGQLAIVDADASLPLIAGFEKDRDNFTPNRDGIDDRVKIQFDLKKDAQILRVYLIDDNGSAATEDDIELEISPLLGARPALAQNDAPFPAGRHVYDYEGGVDLNAQPPADGTYTLVAFAQDAEGQKTRITQELTLNMGGVPYAEIPSPMTAPTVQFEVDDTWQLCETLYFSATVRNYGDVPIRTTGPEPDFVYDSDWNYNTIGWGSESGAFRFAIGYEDEIRNYGYRWATGTREELTKIGDHYYLMPGQQVVVSGGIRLIDKLGERLHQPLWAGLIHEDVAISQLNDRVGRTGINIEYPNEDAWQSCDERPIPEREEN